MTSEPSAKTCSTDRYTQKLGRQQNVMQHGQIYFSITATLKSRIRGSMAMGSKSLCQQKRDAARTDIPQNWDVSKNVTQHGQIYPKTGPSAKT